MWILTKHYYLYPLYKFKQPGNRYYLFKDLIRCNCLDVLQTIKFLTLLYTARGFLSFCLPWGLNPSPSQGSSSAWAGGFTSTTAVLQQPCTQSCSPAGSSLLAPLQYRGCSHGREVSPWPSHQPRIAPAPQRASWHCPERGTAALPELCRVGSPGPSRGWIFADFVLPVLLPALPGLIYWAGIGKTLWVNKKLLRRRSSSSST